MFYHPVIKAIAGWFVTQAYPRPTLAELEAVIDLMCAGAAKKPWLPFGKETSSKHHWFGCYENGGIIMFLTTGKLT